MLVSAIACISPNGGLGKDNQLLGYIPEDLKYFKQLTGGKAMFMGSNTARSLPNGSPLPNRTNYVLCRESEVLEFTSKGFVAIVSDSVASAVSEITEKETGELMIIGGAFIYSETLSLLDKLYLNVGHELPLNADCFFCEVKSITDINRLDKLKVSSHQVMETASHGLLSCYVLERQA